MQRNRLGMLGAGAAVALAVTVTPAMAAAPGSTGSAVLPQARQTPALASDFNGDGVADLAITAPWDDYDGHGHTPGGVHVFYGQAATGTKPADLFLGANSAALPVARDALMGVSIASGDFDGDGYADLAMGAPSYDLPGEAANCGAVVVVYGTAHGLDPAASPRYEVWTQDSPGVQGSAESDDTLGTSMAAGDFDADGYLDLAVGAEGETIGAGERHQGTVLVLYGSGAGLTAAGDQTWSQDTPGIKGTAETGDRAASSMTAGDFDGDGADDLAMGVADEAIGSAKRSGAVNVIYGRPGHGLSDIGDVFVSQDTTGVPGAAEKDDSFGQALAAGDTNGDGRDELVIGAPQESVGDGWRLGVVTVMPGSQDGLVAAHSASFTTPGIGATAAQGAFGSALALGDVDADGFDELAAGAPLSSDYGMVYVLRGSMDGLTIAGATVMSGTDFSTDDLVSNSLGASLWFGAADTTPGDDLLIGDPYGATPVVGGGYVQAGVAHLLTSDGTTLDPMRSVLFHEGRPGVVGAREKADRFGNGFPGSSYPW